MLPATNKVKAYFGLRFVPLFLGYFLPLLCSYMGPLGCASGPRCGVCGSALVLVCRLATYWCILYSLYSYLFIFIYILPLKKTININIVSDETLRV